MEYGLFHVSYNGGTPILNKTTDNKKGYQPISLRLSSSRLAPFSSYSSSITLAQTEREKGPKHLVDSNPNMKTLPSKYILPLPENPLLVSKGSIPTIDLSGLNGSEETRLSTVGAITSACTDCGFFRITNHGIDVSLMEEMVSVASDFFNLAWEDKMKYFSEDVLHPVRYGTSLNTSKKHDLHWREYLRHYAHPIQNNIHLWPNSPPTYRNIAKEYLEEVWKLALRIASAISEGLGLDRRYIEESLGEGCQIVACNYYPACPEPDRTLGLPAHSDHGGITILMQNEVDGLQVKHNDEWIGIDNVPGTFVVNVGDYMEILSNGRYKSVEHRAVVNKERTRISVAVANGPELTAIVAPASPLVDEKSEIKFRTMNYKEYLKIQQSNAIRGKNALHSFLIDTKSQPVQTSPAN